MNTSAQGLRHNTPKTIFGVECELYTKKCTTPFLLSACWLGQMFTTIIETKSNVLTACIVRLLLSEYQFGDLESACLLTDKGGDVSVVDKDW